MKQQEQLKAMEQYAKRVLDSDTSGHDWSHIERVVNTTKTIAKAEGADLFICEGIYGEEGKEEKARENKHMTMYEAAQLAKKANPKEMWLTHYSPSLNHPEEYMDQVRKIFENAKAAKDGWTKELRFDEEE